MRLVHLAFAPGRVAHHVSQKVHLRLVRIGHFQQMLEHLKELVAEESVVLQHHRRGGIAVEKLPVRDAVACRTAYFRARQPLAGQA